MRAKILICENIEFGGARTIRQTRLNNFPIKKEHIADHAHGLLEKVRKNHPRSESLNYRPYIRLLLLALVRIERLTELLLVGAVQKPKGLRNSGERG